MKTDDHFEARMERIADLPFYTEGPAVDSKGNRYCSTLTGGSILKIDRENRVTEWARLTCPNGQIILPDDSHLICDNNPAAIRRFDHHGRWINNDMEGHCDGYFVYAPNDLVTDREGNIYFTDSVRDEGKVCFLGVDGRQAIVAGGLDYPNGLVLSADQKCLCVAESYKNRIITIVLEYAGIATGEISVFAELPRHPSGDERRNLPDGLTLDKHRNLWVAHYGMQAVHCFSTKGKLLHTVDTGIPLTSNLIFTDDHTLMITGGYGEPGPGVISDMLISKKEHWTDR
jgi:gluconolactonase